MAQSLAQIYLHIVFSTKDRRPLLRNQTVREELHLYLQGICKKQGSPSLIVGGIEDHVHILCRFGRTTSVAELLRELKRDSSKWLKRRDAEQSAFDWQAGYGAFSVSPSHVPALKRYIRNQQEHHRKEESFQDEFRRLLRKYGVEFDERYIWD